MTPLLPLSPLPLIIHLYYSLLTLPPLLTVTTIADIVTADVADTHGVDPASAATDIATDTAATVDVAVVTNIAPNITSTNSSITAAATTATTRTRLMMVPLLHYYKYKYNYNYNLY